MNVEGPGGGLDDPGGGEGNLDNAFETVCSKCGEANPKGTGGCWNCGQELADESAGNEKPLDVFVIPPLESIEKTLKKLDDLIESAESSNKEGDKENFLFLKTVKQAVEEVYDIVKTMNGINRCSDKMSLKKFLDDFHSRYRQFSKNDFLYMSKKLDDESSGFEDLQKIIYDKFSELLDLVVKEGIEIDNKGNIQSIKGLDLSGE